MNSIESINYSLYIIIYFCICFIYSLFFYRKSKDKSFIRFVITFLIPVLGFVFFIIMDISMKGKGEEIAFDFNQSSPINDYRIYDLNKNKDIVPIEDALLLNDNKVKRGLVIDAVKEQRLDNLGALKAALQDEDTETSHYAASAIMQIKSDFENNMRELSVKYEKNKRDKEILKDYIKTLKAYLDSDLMEVRTKKRLMKDCSDLLKQIIELGVREKDYYIMKIEMDLEREDYSQARQYCELFLKNYKNIEEPYLLAMKMFYQLKDFDQMNKKLEELKGLPISLSRDALQKIRFWMAVTS